ncbi:uncharacterized protein LOC125751808 isoform X11 [Brienomyrus brachyistius]|uniref:uncharacterized protein LOC125751808 isoform X11 n=1 Tax=Brienomyrus brachyistius TaxID=42636 RepID=UPI0020B213CB|nr:uncharacterized protein LOC125751808 isoform X11 [Brienomyrus brachyistius]
MTTIAGMSQENCIIKHEMDFQAETAKHVSDDKTGEEGFEYQLSSSYATHELDQSDLAVQVIQFKASLLEAMEELRFHREAEIEFEERISQLLLEKQELEWQKESLQHQTDMLQNQNTESVTALKKKFQARIKGLEEEKGKYQVTVELKDKEIRTLKEELKLLKLSKCSLQKTLNELEVVKLFQQAQRLLQMQTEAVSRLELELTRQREDYQTLKREHELLRARTREKNDRFASLREEYKSSKTKQEELVDHTQAVPGCPELQLVDHTQTMQGCPDLQLVDHTQTVQGCPDLQLVDHTQTVQGCPDLQLVDHTQTVQGCPDLQLVDHTQSVQDSIQNYISDHKDTSGDSSCETKNKESEYKLSQNGKELVQQCYPASTKKGPSDDNDEGRNPGPTRLRETVSDRLPQADYRVVIQAPDTTVYTSGHADIEGTGRGCCDADLACAAVQLPECPARLARFPAKGPLSEHTADALGVGGGSTGDGEQIKEGGRQEQIKCIPVKREELTIIHSDINQKRTWAVGFGTVEGAGIKRYPYENLGESLNSSDSCPPSELSREYYHGVISEKNNTISDNSATVTAHSHIEPEESQAKLSDKSTRPQMEVKHAYGIKEAGGSPDNSITSIPEKHTSLNIMAENRHQYASLSNDIDITSGNTCLGESKDGAPLSETEITTILSEPLKDDIKHNSAGSDYSFYPRNKRFRSSFDLGVPEKWKWTTLVRNSFGFMMVPQGIQSNQEINISSASVAASLSAEKI